MNRLLFFIFLTMQFATAKAQSSYTEAMQQGDTAFKNNQYNTAINKYFAAEAFDPSKKDLVKEKVSQVFIRIETLRNEAEIAKTDALKEKERAKKAEQKQLLQTNKLAVLNEFMLDNNEQLFKVININQFNLLDLKLKEYNLSKKYDSAFNDSYKFGSFYDISFYFEKIKELDAALIWADSLCEQYPDSALSFERRSVVNYYLHHWKEALFDVDQSLKLNPAKDLTAVLKWNRSLILCNLGRHKESHKSLIEAIGLLAKMPETETWSDDFVSDDIIAAASIYSIFMSRDAQVTALEIYIIINDMYAGTAPIQKLKNIAREKPATNILLSVINYTSTHLQALPNEYIGYLVNGYFWEMANYPKLSESSYRLFLKKNKKMQNKKYTRYKNNFSSPIYNKIKK